MKRVTILGATGSIGLRTLELVSSFPDEFTVAGLAARGSNVELVAELCQKYAPAAVALLDTDARDRLARLLPSPRPELLAGVEGLVTLAGQVDADVVVSALVGGVGLLPTMAAIEAGRTMALANKETLVVAGELATSTARESGGEIIPVDSEHSAILQCLAGRPASQVRRVILTASGGPFRDWSQQQIAHATLADALRHPTWQMGRKITVDSATLANKALEVIEAHFLFQLPYDAIDVVVHPQSVVHSMVEFVDGSVLAQVGVPSMELPVLYALTHPERIEEPAIPSFDPVASSPLTFERVRLDDFPALRLGIEAGRAGGAAPAVFNAANEKAVALFLDGALSFVDIARAISSALDRLGGLPGRTREELLAADAAARDHVASLFRK